jgi:hypothetical protein
MFSSLYHSRFFSDLEQNYVTVLNNLKFHTLSIWGHHEDSPFSLNVYVASKFFIPLETAGLVSQIKISHMLLSLMLTLNITTVRPLDALWWPMPSVEIAVHPTEGLF